MKKFIKKTAATALCVAGILSAVPSAFCAPPGENNGRGRLDGYNAMIVAKYFKKFEDMANLVMVNTKYKDIAAKFHYNPVEINSRKKLGAFPVLETCYISKFKDDFISTFPNDKVKKMIYLPGSFNPDQFEMVLRYNKIVNGHRSYAEEWNREIEINEENPLNGCRITFTSDGKEITFLFAPPYSSRNSICCAFRYNMLMMNYGFDEAVVPIINDYFNPDEMGVTHIGDYAFQNNDNLELASVSSSVISIGKHAFEGCKNLEGVGTLYSVTSIGKSAFKGCEKMEWIGLSSSITKIENHTFENCKNLEGVSIPRSITSIGKSAFKGCEKLKGVNIPNSVTSIGKSAFEGCKSLDRIWIPYSITSIEKNTFKDCENLKDISIPGSVTSIEENAFEGCTSLRRIILDGHVYNSLSEFMQGFYAYKEFLK